MSFRSLGFLGGKMKLKFGDKVHIPDGNGIIVGTDKKATEQPYLVLIGEYRESSGGQNCSNMIWPLLKYIKRGWKHARGKGIADGSDVRSKNK
jgi:hypothetical protein